MLTRLKAFFGREPFCSLALNFRWTLYVIKKVFILDKKNKNLDGIVSLTSYPRRYKDLSKTIKSILMQKTDYNYAVILWIAEGDYNSIPISVINLRKFGLKIISCDDIKSYKKIVPIVRHISSGEFFAKSIIIADDDMNYPPGWLDSLFVENSLYPSDVVAHRVHRIKYKENGLPDKYINWDHCISDFGINDDNFATGCGGVLYPIELLKKINFNSEIISIVCPEGDDIWLYAETRRLGHAVRLTKNKLNILEWESSQSDALWIQNCMQGRNDAQIIKYWELCGGWKKSK